jgi:transposase
LRKAYKYRLYPAEKHKHKLEYTLTLCREPYNSALEHRIGAWKKARYTVTYLGQQNSLPEIKEARPEFQEIYSQVLQDVLRRLDKNFKAFFRRCKNGEEPGFPRFKGKNLYKSLTYSQSGWQFIGDNKIQISKIGIIRIKQHCNFPKNAILKTLTLKREIDKWYAIVSFEIPDVMEKVAVRNAVGIDVGITTFATLSDGTEVSNPKYLAKSIGDCSWGRFIAMVEYKSAESAKYAIAVDPRGTSQLCNICRTRNKISLSVREFECVGCHNVLRRDKNASTNVLQLGLSCVLPMSTEAPAFRQGV